MRGPTFDVIRMRSLSYHEAVPGHHFQLAIQQERTDLPKFRAQRIFGGGSAHSEGWAPYAERLAVEQGWYDGDVPGLLGALGSEQFDCAPVDVHEAQLFKTRQQAADQPTFNALTSIGLAGMASAEIMTPTARREIDDMSRPRQACAPSRCQGLHFP